MDSREHDVPRFPPPILTNQDSCDVAGETSHAFEADQEQFLSLFRCAEAGNKHHSKYLQEQLRLRNLMAWEVVTEQEERGNDFACKLMLVHHEHELERVRVGKEDAIASFQEQLRNKSRGVLIFLVGQAEQGNHEAFEMLQIYYWKEIEDHLRRLMGENDINADLMQEIFLKAWLSLSTRTQKHSLHIRAWFYKIAYSVAIDYLRSKNARPFNSLEDEQESLSTQGPEDGSWKRDCIRIALQQLHPKLRQCIIMRYIQGYTIQEIAVKLGNIQEGTVRGYISHAREQFRRLYLQAVDYEYHSIEIGECYDA